ncbi:MAG TPA: SusC/RagA family TonB-linked outer membrane protein [Chitinophagaceae bacterium]|nr:SusC/RagA family TonB-linked outer membrane protein [Chitinophagaceae bacterium]
MNQYRSKIFLLLLVLIQVAAMAQVKQQDKTAFSGIITDKNKKPLPGISISVQEDNASVRTDDKGSFTIKAFLNDVLLVEGKGFLTQSVTIKGDEEINVSLEKAMTGAGEEDDVIIPFGVRKKREITTAITTFKTENLPQVPIGSINTNLAGRIPGLYVQQTNTQPGNDGASFQIRGRTSFGPNTVDVLVDGVQRELSNIELNEIESITVLKDAASLAWYGLRNGAGVVLITTKSGSPKRSNIHFDVQGGVQIPDRMIKPLNSYDYALLHNEATLNDGNVPIYDATTLAAYKANTNRFRFPNNNYIDSFLNTSAYSQRYVLSADGGNNVVRYFVLLSYLNQGGLFKYAKNADYNSNVGFDRFNFRGNVDFDVSKTLTVGLNAAGRSEGRSQPGGNETGGLLNLLYNTPPNAFPILNENGTYGGSSQFQSNPLGLMRERGYTTTTDRVLMATINAKQKLDFVIKGLSANVLFSYDVLGQYASGLNKDYQVTDATGTTPVLFRNITTLGYRGASFSNSNRRNEIWAGLDYDRVFNNHSVKASVRANRSSNAAPSRLDFRSQSISARSDYSFKNKYYVGVVGSYSGSENFPPGNRYGFFPAVSAGWILSDEGFFKQNKILSYTKLRASYGKAGSSDIGGDRFPFEHFWARNTGGGGYTFGTGFSATSNANEVSLANPFITWENIKTLNTGVDLQFFDNALSVSADYFKTNRSGILTASSIPGILGMTLTENAGEVESKGVELNMSFDRKIGKLMLTVYGNALFANDKVLAENGQIGLPEYQRTIGRVVGSRLVFLSDGIFQNQAEIDRSPKQVLSGKVVAGDIKYKDIGGAAGKPDGIIDNLDRVRINERDQPTSYFGFGTKLAYKFMDLAIHMNGALGRTIDVQGIVNSGPTNFNEESLKRWTPATGATAVYPRLGIADRANNTSGSDFWLRSGDYLRLKNMELGFNFPSKFLNKYSIAEARFYVGGFNLLSFDKLDIDIDPEVPGSGRGSAYPYIKTIYLGLRTSF